MSKYLKITIGIVLLVVGLGVALFFAEPKADEHVGMNNMQGAQLDENNKLALDSDSYDFGTISMKNGKVTKTFTATNSKPGAVELTRLYTSCMCTDASIKIGNNSYGPFGMLGHGIVPALNQVLESNSQAEISVTFDPNAHGPAGVGEIEREITVEGKSGILAVMKIKANVTP